MTLDELRERASGRVRTSESRGRVFYTRPSCVRHLCMHDHEFEKIKDWETVCIRPSRRNEPNLCTLFGDDDLTDLVDETKVQLDKIYAGREDTRW